MFCRAFCRESAHRQDFFRSSSSYRAAGRRFVEEERSWARSVARYRAVYAAALGRAV